MIRVTAAVTIAAAIALAGCGSDSSGDTTAPTFSVPAVTSPLGTTTTAPASTTTAPFKTGGPETRTFEQHNHFKQNQPDSATNDLPPPSGSPQESFEKQCQENPQACQ